MDDDFVINLLKCLQNVSSLMVDLQGWMLLLSVWISSKQK